MSSVLSAISQQPRSGDHFVAYGTGAFFYADWGTNTLPDGFIVGTSGVQSKSGGVIVSNTVANVNTNLGVAGLANYASPLATAATDYYRDMGKKIQIYTLGTTGPAELYAVFTRVRLVKGDANNVSEGENGRLGYICTWSAVPTTGAVAPLFARIGSGYSR
jgi:hypothetical protein